MVVGLIDNGQNAELRMTYKDASSVSPDARTCVLTIVATIAKPGASKPKIDLQATSSAPTESSTASPSAAKRSSLRTAQAGAKGSAARAVTASTSEKTVIEPSPSEAPKKDKSSKKKKEKEKKKHIEEEEDEEVAEEDDIADNEFKEPPRRPKTKVKVVPDDEDPSDFWNGTSKSKTKEKKKEIKKLQQSLESMTINLRASRREGKVNDDQKRFAVMINEIGRVNIRSDAWAGYTRTGAGLSVRLAFIIDLPSDRASGCGIDVEKWMYVEMTFPNSIYASEEPKAASKTLTVRQCSPVSSSDALSRVVETFSFGLWWTLEQRLSTWMREEWPNIVEKINKAAKKASKSSTDVEVSSDAWAMLEILEWSSSQLPIAIKALMESKNDVKQALELVLDEDWLEKAKKETKVKHEDGDKSQTAEHSVKMSGDTCFLEDVIQETVTMIKDAGKFCPICAKPHPLELFKPIVCDNDLCKFQFSNMGLGVDFESELLHSPMAVDLLIALTDHAVSGSHFDPFPSEVSAQIDGVTHALKTPGDVAAVLKTCPSVDDMVSFAKQGRLRKALAELHPLLYLLLRWIVTSSRAHLHFLGPEDTVPQIDTPFQFHMKSTPPEKELKFYAAKKKYGSFYAWHGSATSNWHSILRNGLKNYSNSKHQVNGAAYGPGVYMAVDSATSIGYSSYRHYGNCWPHSKYEAMMGNGTLLVLALCEVINEGELICTGNVHRPRCIHSTSAPYYRIEKDEYITTRYLFVIQRSDVNVLAASIQSHLKSKQLLRSNKAHKEAKKK